MVGPRSGLARQIKNQEPSAIFTHCYGHSLQLTVGDIIKRMKNIKNALDANSEISKLLKYSRKRDSMFRK